MKNIIILSKPGAGKGTISQKFIKENKYTLITTGDILREQKETDTELGKLLRETINSGKLISDDVINEIVENKLKTTKGPYLFDGYPRTIQQADFLSKIINIDLVVYLEVSDEIVINRILKRGETSGREDDKSLEIINKRITIFKKETQLLIDYYKDILSEINAEQSIDKVFSDFNQLI